MTQEKKVQVLREPYAGYAPGTEFTVIRRHQHAPVVTVSPVDNPLRAITIPMRLMGER